MANMDGLLYENIPYGAYVLEYERGSAYTENVRYGTAAFSRLYTQKIRLPDGYGNVLYILSDTFQNSLNLLSGNHFMRPASWRRVFYPKWFAGNVFGRRVRFVIKDFKQRNEQIKKATNLIPYMGKTLQKGRENVIFLGSDLYAAMLPVLQSYPLKKNYDNFYPTFTGYLRDQTPEIVSKATGPDQNNRILLIDCNAFQFNGKGQKLDTLKTNPLYLLYMAYFKNHELQSQKIDMDILLCADNLFIKLNPAKISRKEWPMFKMALFRIVDANLDEINDQLPPEEKKEVDVSIKDHTVSGIVQSTTAPYTKNVSISTKNVLNDAVEKQLRKKIADVAKMDQEIKLARGDELPPDPLQKDSSGDLFKSSLIHKDVINDPLTSEEEKLFKSIGGYQSLVSGEEIGDGSEEDGYEDDLSDYQDYEDQIQDDANDVLTNDPEVAAEVLDEIQDKVVPMKDASKAPVNSARDQKLREQQKKVTVENSTIEEILQRDSSNVPIEEDDVSKVMHTTNQNMYDIKFANFDKTYIDKLMTKDLVSCFDMLKDKDSPFYITGIDVRDSSTSLDLKETWTVHLMDEVGKKHTIKVDIPKFQDDRFMYLNGTRFIILKQNFYNPLVKDTPDTVILTTNFNKVTIDRKATKSLGTIERIFSLIKKTGDQKVFMTGDSSKSNMKYISTLEYDELSRVLFRYTSNGCELYFSRDYLYTNMKDQMPSDMKANEFFIGFENKIPVLINEDTGLDRQGRTIADIIEANLSDSYKETYEKIKAPKQMMYVEAKMAGAFLPIIAILVTWIGLTNTLDRMKIRWKFNPDARRVPPQTGPNRYVRFLNGVLEYEAQTFSELIMNGIRQMMPEKFNFEDFNTEVGYQDYIYSIWGSYRGIDELKNFKEFLVDPITKDVCKDMNLPDDAAGLLIHAVKLLCDNAYVSKADDRSYRVRSIEMIPGILYGLLAKQYKAYVKSGRKMPMTLNQRAVISALLMEKTVEAYSTLNPAIEVSKTHTISTKGYKGSNSDHAYRDEQKRSYDPSAVGKLAISTSPDANVGINKQLVVEPTLTNARGYREPVQDITDLKDVNIFSPLEMLTPGTARNDDPIRTAIAGKQSGHVVPVKDAMPSLVSNGFDEAVQFYVSDDFVINAEEDGKVIDVNPEVGFIVVQYKSGKTRAISTNPEIVRNSANAFYLANKMKIIPTKVGQTFKKNEPLAYHEKYFRYSKMNGLRYAIGPLAKMAMMSSYNTYEDAGICTEALAEKMKTSIVYQEQGRFKWNNNIISMVKVGDHVNIGDPLIKYDVTTDDTELAKFLSKLSDESAAIMEEETKDEIKSKHAGEVIDIKVYTLLPPEDLSDSLGKIVQQYFDQGNAKKTYLNQYDSLEGIMKAGYMLTDSTEPVKNKYNSIKGIKGIDVLIEIYIEHDDVMGVGDKVALYGPNKQIISEVIPKGYEPYSEFRPDEEISVMTSPGTIARRMTPSIMPIAAAMKIMIELKRKIKDEIKYK